MFNSQDGIKQKAIGKKTDYSTDNLFAGVWRLDQTNLDRFDPFVTGYAYIIWTKMPAFFDTDVKTQFQNLTEKNFKSFDGVSDMTLNTEDVTMGFAGNALGVATSMTKENTSFTLRHYELAGSPVRELYQHWVTGIRDPETGLSHYHGKVDTIAGGYSMKNHSGELLYIVTDPSGGNKGIEFAAYYTNVFPTKIPQQHLNYSSGEHGLTEIDIEFKGNFHTGKEINTLAVDAMKYYKINKQFGDYGLGNGVKESVTRGFKENASY